MKLFTLILFSLFILFFESSIVYSNENELYISGNLTNLTNYESSVADVEITLHISSLETESQTFSVLTNVEGNFEFKDVPYLENSLYGVSLIYQDAIYVESVIFDKKVPLDIEINVYDSSSSDDSIIIQNASMVFDNINSELQVISVLEVVTILNDSLVTYVPGEGPMDLLRFGLPADALNLNVDTNIFDSNYVQVDKGFALIASILPGSHELTYSYEIPYQNSIFEYIKNWRYGANNLRIIIPSSDIVLNSNFSDPVVDTEIGGRVYSVLETQNVAKGFESTIEIKNLPKSVWYQKFSQDFNSLKFEYSAPIALSLVLFITAIWGISNTLKFRKRSNLWFPGSSEKQVLEDMMSELEIKHNSGVVSDDYYFSTKNDLLLRQSNINETQ
tara:strand:+ start:4849 stop:6015 length:1167 start_codon:yes stop_codon:yes gene_type:complete